MGVMRRARNLFSGRVIEMPLRMRGRGRLKATTAHVAWIALPMLRALAQADGLTGPSIQHRAVVNGNLGPIARPGAPGSLTSWRRCAGFARAQRLHMGLALMGNNTASTYMIKRA
jgi:hypothetical protein